MLKGLYYLPVEVLQPSQRSIFNIESLVESEKRVTEPHISPAALRAVAAQELEENSLQTQGLQSSSSQPAQGGMLSSLRQPGQPPSIGDDSLVLRDRVSKPRQAQPCQPRQLPQPLSLQDDQYRDEAPIQGASIRNALSREPLIREAPIREPPIWEAPIQGAPSKGASKPPPGALREERNEWQHQKSNPEPLSLDVSHGPYSQLGNTTSITPTPTSTATPRRRIASQLFHRRMAHISSKALKALAKQCNLELVSNSFDFDRCSECNEAKMI
jgi:hypothetical protein